MLNGFECWRCGKIVELDEEPRERVYCDECKDIAILEHKYIVKQYAELKKKIMVDTAIRKMEKAGMYMHEYKDIASDIANEVQTGDDKFLSADEIIAAMVLRSYNIEYEANKPIGGYSVDFYIPSMCVCLEIDGDRHEMNTIKDSRRDIDIRALLGEQWEVIRIKTNYLEKNPEMLVEAIEALYNRKKKLRKDNNGIIPEYFSRREKDLYNSLTQWKRVSEKNYPHTY